MGNFYISSVYNNNKDYSLISECVELSRGKVGVEFFAMELTADKILLFKDMKKQLENVIGSDKNAVLKSTFHSPMVKAEATAMQNTEDEKNLFENWAKSLDLCKELSAKHIVFHTNNKRISQEERHVAQANSMRNCLVLDKMCKKVGVTLLVETLGLPCSGAPIFTENEFIDFVVENDLSALVDVGHMNLNGYNYSNVISTLGDKIKAYHVHNNDGTSDSHNVCTDGTFDYNLFAQCYKKYTPDADMVIEYIDVPNLSAEKVLCDIQLLENLTK